MTKLEMRDWVAALEEMIDNKLRLWKKGNPIENGESVRLSWQFEQTCIQIFLFWEDGKEFVNLKCMGPRADHGYSWSGLDNRTFNKICDRIGNLAQVIMHPPIDPMD